MTAVGETCAAKVYSAADSTTDEPDIQYNSVSHRAKYSMTATATLATPLPNATTIKLHLTFKWSRHHVANAFAFWSEPLYPTNAEGLTGSATATVNANKAIALAQGHDNDQSNYGRSQSNPNPDPGLFDASEKTINIVLYKVGNGNDTFTANFELGGATLGSGATTSYRETWAPMTWASGFAVAEEKFVFTKKSLTLN